MNKYDINNIVEESFKHIDDYKDNFQLINDVQTDLLLGNRSAVCSPLITVIIPTYNRYELLKEAIDSVLNQIIVDFEWEFIVIDNTPFDTDNQTPAFKLIRDINDEKILYYHNRVNIGSGYNWNRAVELARGKWVTFLHDDDIMCSDALFNIKKIMDDYQNIKKPLGYIHTHKISFSESFDEKRARKKRLPVRLRITRNLALVYGHTATGCPSCGTTILKDAYMRTGGINYDFGPTADAILGYQIMKWYTVIKSDVVLGGYRWGDNETLKPITIKSLLKSDQLFAEYRYSQNKTSYIWGRYMGDVIRLNNVKGKLKLSRDDMCKFEIERNYVENVNLYWLKNMLQKVIISLVLIYNIRCLFNISIVDN